MLHLTRYINIDRVGIQMNKPKIGMIGLGSIAQKAYLPTLTKELDWHFVGAFTPNAEKENKFVSNIGFKTFILLKR